MAMSASKDRPGVEVPRIWCKRKCFEIVASIRLRTAKTQNAEAPIFGCGGAPASALSPRRSEHRRPLPPVRRRGYLVEGFHRVPRARVATSCKVCRLCGTGVRNDARQIFRLARLPAAGRGRQDLIQSQFRADLCRFLAAPRLLTRSIGFVLLVGFLVVYTRGIRLAWRQQQLLPLPYGSLLVKWPLDGSPILWPANTWPNANALQPVAEHKNWSQISGCLGWAGPMWDVSLV